MGSAWGGYNACSDHLVGTKRRGGIKGKGNWRKRGSEKRKKKEEKSGGGVSLHVDKIRNLTTRLTARWVTLKGVDRSDLFGFSTAR